MPILPVTMSGAVVKRRGKVLLGPVDLTISDTGFTIVMGPNGAGKTTFLRGLHGLERLAPGGVTWQVPLADARGRQAFVFQSPIMLWRMRAVGRNVLVLPVHVISKRQTCRGAKNKNWPWRAP